MTSAFDESTAPPEHPRTAADPPRIRRPLRAAALRMAILVVAAACIYGTWAFLANLAHGVPAAVRAGATQGASSGFTTLVIGSVIEAIHAALPRRRHRALLATAASASLSALVHVGVHLASGTPEILRTILPSVVMGYVFAASYAFALEGPRIRVTHRRPESLDATEREAIWSLLARSVQRDRRAFEDKLGQTDEVFLGHLPDGELVVFGAVDTVEHTLEGRAYAVLYSHWAVADPRARGRNVVQRAGFRSFLRYRLRHPLRPVYWMFTASTFHSYLLLVNNFETYWPQQGTSWPPRERALVSAAMRRSGDPSWDAEAGILRRKGASRYREGVVDDEPAILHHPTLGPAVRFYRDRNPGQAEGDSLVCLCPLTASAWVSCVRAALRRVVRRRRA